jgi:hypothetical protein
MLTVPILIVCWLVIYWQTCKWVIFSLTSQYYFPTVTLNRTFQRRKLPINYRIIYNTFVQDIPDQHIFICINASVASKRTLQTSQISVGLRHCAMSRKVTGLIRDGVIGTFHWRNPSGHTTVQGSTQPLNKNQYQEYFLGGRSVPGIGLTTLPPSCANCPENWELQPPGALRACPGL